MAIYGRRSRCLPVYSTLGGTSCVWKPAEKEKTVVCRGNLVHNGGFEVWKSPYEAQGWSGSNVLSSSCAHTGIASVQLSLSEGKECNLFECLPSFISQEVHVCPGTMLLLKFYIALFVTKETEDINCGNPPLQATLTWLDVNGCEVGPGICLYIPARTLGPGWFYYDGRSSTVPSDVKTARLVFAKSKGLPILLDDVSLIFL